ncbi:DUF5665 domain-containing protein [Alteribacter keqinensis]|uniref:Uncharacterized protein n=1 Tax=Alteribacter keqinensis TaxID=2483800 RepID=A0A3M7TW29_9BACI|nr:DUF5665 domain-containing protein [Alteribacter keqinensis]RNA69778.1 hypothetical protein EBO34_07540 [Alteribacter keqinensis]
MSGPFKDKSEIEHLVKKLEYYTRRLEKLEHLDHNMDKINYALERAKIRDILLNYTNPRRVFMMNILVGIGRGLGLTIGTVVVISLVGLILRQFVDLPLIGDWISTLLQYVDSRANPS